jgi:hypothetical protein
VRWTLRNKRFSALRVPSTHTEVTLVSVFSTTFHSTSGTSKGLTYSNELVTYCVK